MSHLIFTSDFHEIIRGKLKENTICEINYDPARITNGVDGYIFGSPDFQVTAHLQFQSGVSQTIPLISKTGWLEHPVLKTDGTGSMLTGEFTIPPGTEEITAWFQLTDPAGQLFYDSDFGKNFHFRLAENDILVTKAKIKNSKKLSIFDIAVEAVPKIDRVLIRYRITNSPEPHTKHLLDLTLTKTKGKTNTWTAPVAEIPPGAVVVYDINYFIAEKRFISENNGNYFIAE